MAWNRSSPPLPLPPAVCARPRHQGLPKALRSDLLFLHLSVPLIRRYVSRTGHSPPFVFSTPPPLPFRSKHPNPQRNRHLSTFRALLTIPDVPIRLSTDTPEIVPGPYQPACICARLARSVDPRSERLEIFIDSGP